jgi:Phytanoyl-CoA dioxygenase (PhyH)
MEWREEVEANGFGIREGVLPEDWANESINEDVRRSPMRGRAGLRHALFSASVRHIAGCKPMKQLSCAVLGPRAFAFRATIFDKSPRANWLVAWHQDRALPLRHRIDVPGWGPWSSKAGILYAHAPAEVLSQILALRVHLDDSTSGNGPLRVLPRTHRLGVLSDERIHELSEQRTPVECIVSRGGVMAMRPLLIHSSSKSKTEVPRRVLHIEYAASESIAAPLELERV